LLEGDLCTLHLRISDGISMGNAVADGARFAEAREIGEFILMPLDEYLQAAVVPLVRGDGLQTLFQVASKPQGRLASRTRRVSTRH
jgi:hypothetical protein